MDFSSLIIHLAEHAPGFAARLKNAGLQPEQLRTTDELDLLPVMRKDDLVELQAANPPFGGFLACSPGELKRIYQSPGPIYEPESRTSDYWRWAPALRANGFGPEDLVLNTFSYHLTPAGAMFEEGLLAAGCAVIPGGVGNQEQQVMALHSLGITGYTGLPSYLKALLDKSAELELPLKLVKAFVTAEPLPPSLRAYINARGVTIRQGYGTAECGNLGFECEQENGWHLPEDATIQVCDLNSGLNLPEGQVGEIVVTLFLRDYALVRFGTGDLSSLNASPCPCGRKTPRLMGWQGRVGDAVKVRGVFLHPRQVSGMMARFPEVASWQAVITRQEHKDYLTLKVVLTGGEEGSSFAERLAQVAREAIKLHPAVEIGAPGSIPENAPPIQDERIWE